MASTAEQAAAQDPGGAEPAATDEALLYSSPLIGGQDQDLLTSNVQSSSGAGIPQPLQAMNIAQSFAAHPAPVTDLNDNIPTSQHPIDIALQHRAAGLPPNYGAKNTPKE